MNKIPCSFPVKHEIISRVFQTKEEAKTLLNDYKIESPFNPYVKINNSKTGWYVCYYASWNIYRIQAWYKWLKDKGLVCYLVKA